MSKNNNSSNSSGGIGFTGVLTIVFIVLKLTGAISWTWLWVLSPMWISLVLFVIILATAFLIKAIIRNKRRKRRRTEYWKW